MIIQLPEYQENDTAYIDTDLEIQSQTGYAQEYINELLFTNYTEFNYTPETTNGIINEVYTSGNITIDRSSDLTPNNLNRVNIEIFSNDLINIIKTYSYRTNITDINCLAGDYNTEIKIEKSNG